MIRDFLNTVEYEKMSKLQSKYVTALKMAVDQKKAKELSAIF